MDGVRYKNPPIQEVIFEINLDEHTPWDLAVPGIVYEKLKGDFPLRERRRVQEVELTQTPSGSALTVKDTERAIFLDQERRCLVQIGDRLLAINQLPPYPGWKGLKRAINIAYKALNDSVQVRAVQGLLLRYLDKVEIPGADVRIEDYFLLRPHFEGVPEGSPLDYYETFIVGIQVPFYQGRDRLRIQLVPGPASRGTVFNLETHYRCSLPMEPDRVPEWLEIAHERVIEAFERVITDKLRATFQPE